MSAKNFRLAVFVFSALLLGFAVPEAGARSGIEVRQGVVWIGNAYREQFTGTYIEGSDVSPLISLTGIGVDMEVSDLFRFAPGIDFWSKDYAFTEGRAVPTQIETGPSVGQVARTVGAIVSAPVDARIETDEGWFGRAGFSPSLLVRIPILPVEGSSTDELTRFFYSRGRFLYPELRLAGGYHMEQRITFQFSGRAFLPLFNLWETDPDLPLWDQMMIAGQLAIRLRW